MDPFTLGGLALQGGSIFANMFADDARRRAYDDAMRNAGYTDLAFQGGLNDILGRAENRYANFGGSMAAKNADLGRYFTGQSSPAAGQKASAVPAQGAPKPSSAIMANESAKQSGLAQAFSDQQGRALGNLRSFDQTLGDVNRGVNRDFGDLSRLLSFRRGAANLLPGQVANAQRAGGAWQGLADLFGGAGKLALNYGLGGGGAPGSWYSPGYFSGGSFAPSLSGLFG